MWILWILLSNIGIMWLEFAYRQGTYTNFWSALPYITLPIFMGQIGLFYGFRLGPSILMVGATFTLLNVGLRVINAYRLGETINIYNWMGIALLIVSMFLLKVK